MNNCPNCDSTKVFMVWLQEGNTLKPTEYKFCQDCERFLRPKMEVVK